MGRCATFIIIHPPEISRRLALPRGSGGADGGAGEGRAVIRNIPRVSTTSAPSASDVCFPTPGDATCRIITEKSAQPSWKYASS